MNNEPTKDDLIKKYELEGFIHDINNIESPYLNLIYSPLFDIVCTRDEYERIRDMMEWTCAICGCNILINKRKYDVENFVCEKCKEVHNNKNQTIDMRILNSRTKLYKKIENDLYQQLEDCLGKKRGF